MNMEHSDNVMGWSSWTVTLTWSVIDALESDLGVTNTDPLYMERSDNVMGRSSWTVTLTWSVIDALESDLGVTNTDPLTIKNMLFLKVAKLLKLHNISH